MSFSPLYPYYGPLGRGNFNVSLAFPGPKSTISKEIGLDTATGLIFPNTDYLMKFAQGDLGIGDSIITNMIYKNMNSSITSNDEAVFRQFAKNCNYELGDDISKYKKGNRYVLPKSAIKVPDAFNSSGFKALEKTIFQSIFETQKPFMEIAQIAIGSVIKAEDIIARVMPLFGANPLKTKSRKPVGNSGASSRPAAIGYKGAVELKAQLQILQQLQLLNGTASVTGITASNGTIVKDSNDNSSSSNVSYTQRWQILSTVYSTGLFNPNVEYTYSYIDLPADDKLPTVTDSDEETPDPYEQYKPKTIILGIYNSKGVAVDPGEYLTTIGLDGNNSTKVTTPYKRAEWLLNSPKWKFQTGTIEWPSFSTPNYVWERNFLGSRSTKVSKTNPSGYDLKKYKAGDTNIITGETAIPDDPIIQSFDVLEEDSYRSYYNALIDISLYKEQYLKEEERLEYSKEINDRIELLSQLEVTFNYGHTKSSYYNQVNGKAAFPATMKKSYKPYLIYVSDAEKDADISKYNSDNGIDPGYIWVDPEADYDMKVIRIDAITSEVTSNTKGANTLNTTSRTFVKNRMNFVFSTGIKFGISLTKNDTDTKIFNDVTSYSLENWNYENKTVKNTNKYKINVWSKVAPKKYSSNYYEFPIKRNTQINNSPITTSNIWSNINIKYKDINTQWRYLDNTTTNTTNQSNTNLYYSIRKSGDTWYYDSNDNSYVKSGIITLDDKTVIEVDKTVITKWFYIYDKEFIGPGIDTNLPTFGVDRTLTINYDNNNLDITNKSIAIWGVLKSNTSSSTIINSTPVSNDFLSTAELFIKPDVGYYGHGSEDDPQDLGIIERFAMTDTDDESYYIVEGVLKSDNELPTDDDGNRIKNGAPIKGGGGGWYKLPHAIGVGSQFVRLLIDIITKMIPKITKLLKLFQNPSTFLTDIMGEKLKKNFSFLSDDAISTLTKSNNINVDNKQQQVKRMRDYYKSSVLSNYVYYDDKTLQSIFTLDGSATTPFSLFGLDLSFGLASNMGSLPNKKPIELIFKGSKGVFKNLQYLNQKTTAGNKSASSSIEEEIIDLKSPIQSKLTKLDKQPPYLNSTLDTSYYSDKVQIKFEDGSTTYIPSNSLQTFVKENESKYNFIYVTEGLDKVFANVDDLISKGTQEDLNNATALLDRKQFPDSSAIDDKQKEIDEKNKDFMKNVQPLLKTLLGFVKFPLKLIADIIQWMFDFFKSLTNPMKLASKMKEFLSFQWILKFFTPKGILEIFGFKFNAAALVPFAAEAALTSGKLPNKSGVPTINSSAKIDLSKFLNVGFIPTLPTFSADQYKNFLKGNQPLRTMPILTMLEQIINKIIDFIWSLLGIEALIKAPHIKLTSDSSSMNPEDIQKIIDGIEPNGNTSTSDNNPITGSGDASTIDSMNPGVETFIYYITLPDGTVQQYLNREELDKFISEHSDINYDFTF